MQGDRLEDRLIKLRSAVVNLQADVDKALADARQMASELRPDGRRIDRSRLVYELGLAQVDLRMLKGSLEESEKLLHQLPVPVS